jgi:Protein of unknown function (DUF3987)
MIVFNAAERLRQRVSAADEATGRHGEWPDPKPLPDGLPYVEPFVPNLLPAALRPWVMDISERMQCPPDFTAAAAIVALGSVIGRRCAIRPKRHDDWTVVPNLWGAVIGRPGVLKSPAIEEALRPLHRLEAEAGEAHAAAMRAFEGERAARALERRAREEVAKREFKKGAATREEIAEKLAALGNGDAEPIRARYIVNDSTVEKLGELLVANPAGLLLFRDELVAWLRSFDREGREGDRAFYLEAWNGNGRFTYDRIGRGTVEIPATCVSVFGAIQPGPLLAYLSRSAFDGVGDDGLLQRLQVVVWPDLAGMWRNVDRWPDTKARQAAFGVFAQLAELVPALPGAEQDALDCNGVPFLRFDDKAQVAFDEWRGVLEYGLRTGEHHPAWEAYLAKHRKLIPALALICHLADGGAGPVSLTAFKRAEMWAEYLKSHATRLYGGLIRPDLSAAQALGDHVVAGDLGGEFALRDVYRRCWSGLTSREAARSATAVLCDHDWLAEAPRMSAGRTATVYLVNPKLWAERS